MKAGQLAGDRREKLTGVMRSTLASARRRWNDEEITTKPHERLVPVS
jgi:hypothetical protein